MTQDDNSAALAQQQQIENQQYLLTMESYYKWVHSLSEVKMRNLILNINHPAYTYFAEHGLPADSQIEGL